MTSGRPEGGVIVTWILGVLVGRVVAVQVDRLKICGRLLAVSESQRYPLHVPGVLVLETASGLCIIREWTVIAFSGRL